MFDVCYFIAYSFCWPLELFKPIKRLTIRGKNDLTNKQQCAQQLNGVEQGVISTTMFSKPYKNM
jgi:hypothetical protein